MTLLLAVSLAALAGVVGITGGLADPLQVTAMPRRARRWAAIGAALACLSLGLTLAALVLSA